jgi:hypothetical protein
MDFEGVRGSEKEVGRITLEELSSLLIESGHSTKKPGERTGMDIGNGTGLYVKVVMDTGGSGTFQFY